MSADEAPWGHDRLPTVLEGARGRPRDAVATGVMAVFAGLFAYLGGTDWSESSNLSAGQALVLAVVVAVGLWWLLMFAQIRGWVSPVQFHE